MQIPTYTQQVTPQGGIGAQATPADFGAQVGQGLQALGQGVGQASDMLFKAGQDQGRIWAYEASSKTFENLKQTFQQQVNQLDPNDPEFSSKVSGLTASMSDQIDRTTSDLQTSAPTPMAARIVALHAAFNGRSLLNYAMGEQARLAGAYTGKLVQDGMKSDQDSISSDPSNDNFQRILANRQQMIGSLDTVDPAAKIKWQGDIEHGLAVTQVQTFAATRPNDLLSAVSAQGGRTTVNGTVRGAVPGGQVTITDLGADTVRPYTAQRVAQITSAVNAPSQYDDIFKAEAAKNGLDWKELKMRAVVESGLNPNAIGPQTPNGQSVGIMQIERGNATSAGIDPTNPQQSIAWAAKQLAAYRTQAGGDMSTVDKTYYGGQDQSQWGKNTGQYAANLGAVRAAMGSPAGAGLPQVQPLTDAQVDSANPPIAGWSRLTWQEKIGAVRQAEAAVGGKLASERGAMTSQLHDAQASLLAGKSYPGIDSDQFSQANFTRLFGPEEGQRRYDQLNYTRQVGGFVSQMATMPAAQAQATLGNLAPQGGPEFAAKQPVFKAATEAYQRLDKARNNDFMQWATDNKVANVSPIDFSTPYGLQNSLHDRIAVANAGVSDYGADAHLLSKNEVDTLGDALSRMNPQQQMSYVKALRIGTTGNDAWYRDVLGQIAPKNTTLAQAAAISTHDGTVATAGGPQDGNMVGQYVLEGAHILQGKDLDDPTHTGRPLALDDKTVRTAFWNAVGPNAFASGDAQRSSQIANDTYQAVKNYLAADIYHRGLDPRSIGADQVQNAVNAVTGGTAKVNGDSLFVPWGMDPDGFRSQFPARAQAAIDAAGLKGTPLDKLDAYHFVNLDDGKYGMTNGNRMLVGKDGRTVVIDFNKPFGNQQAGGAVSADGHSASGRIQ